MPTKLAIKDDEKYKKSLGIAKLSSDYAESNKLM